MPNTTQKPTSKAELKKDLKTLGSLLKTHLVAAWNSKQRKDAENAIAQGVESAVGAIRTIVEDAKAGTLEGKIRSHVHSALQKSNRELAKAKKIWKPLKKKKE